MSERSVSCPGCLEKFGLETHIPLIGSCGHSICSSCAIENVCSVCHKPSSFPWMQYEPAIKLLVILAQTDVQQPKLEPVEVSTLNRAKQTLEKHEEPAEEPRDALPAILDPNNAEVPVNTVNQIPVCKKEGGSTSIQKNDLNLDLLDSGAGKEEAEKSETEKMFFEEEACAADKPIPAIVNPENLLLLAPIVNQLDPSSFLKLARSCKYLYNFCFNSKDVKIIYNISWMFFENMNGVGEGEPDGFLGSSSNRKKLKNYPFHFHLKRVRILSFLDEEAFVSLRSFFSEFPIEAIEEFYPRNVGDWHGFQRFMKDFHIKDVRVDRSFRNYPIPEDVLTYILQKTVKFFNRGNIPDHLLLNATVTKLDLWDTKISQATFIDLIKRFANSTEEVTWKLDKQSFEFGHFDLFNVLLHDENGPLPEERPLIFVKNGDNDRFYILRKDGKVLRCDKYGFFLTFSTNDLYGYPIVFPDL